mmetsp:Transcript_23482/g.35656  ORF Transcript_23482/g.35656 Transcript_23482/m.35656 type:complete len:81 (+) Transcript_23482:106-348(+)
MSETTAPAGPAGPSAAAPPPQLHQSYESLYADEERHPKWSDVYDGPTKVMTILPTSVQTSVEGPALKQQLNNNRDSVPMT